MARLARYGPDPRATEDDARAALLLIGCQHPEWCPWVGVVTITRITGSEQTDQRWRSCREHAALFRKDPLYVVTDVGISNQRLAR